MIFIYPYNSYFRNMAKQRSEDKKGNGRKITNKQSPHSRSATGNKKRKQAKLRSESGIAKSKQLLNKLKTTRSTSSTRSSRSNSTPRVCGNGMPMPSLAELELMYDDDSDDDQNNNFSPTTPQTVDTGDTERCKTPIDKPLVISEDKLTSPTTLKVIASKMMDLISNLPIITIDEDIPLPPVIPPKKRKKPDTPYIVGCKERCQVPWAPKTSFCKGDDNYGVEQQSNSVDDDENPSPKKRRRSGAVNVSKSLFNAKSDEIASWLKRSEQLNEQIVMPECSAEQCKRTLSSDSDKTVDYNFGAGSPQNVNKFSPLPSTSRDNDVFLKNVQLFNESLNSTIANKSTDDSDNDIEIVDAPVETVVINDSLPVRKIEPMNDTDEDFCVIVETNASKIDTSVINIDSPNDNGYGSLDFNLNLENSDCEIIDVDDVLAESQAIIAKYKKQDGLDSVTVVDPGRSYAPKTANISLPAHTLGPSNLISNDSITVQEPTENTTDLQEEDTSAIAIEDVVTNFFGNSNNVTSNLSTIDLTEVSEIPRDWTTWVSSLPQHSNWHLNGQNVQSAVPPGTHKKDPPTSVRAQASVCTPVAVTNMPAANTLNLVIADLSHVSTNRNQRNKAPPPQPSTISVMTPPPEIETQRNLASKHFGDCPICMESLGNSPIASTLCGHIFCMECIKASIRTSGKRCPTCRKVLKANGYHQLFL